MTSLSRCAPIPTRCFARWHSRSQVAAGLEGVLGQGRVLRLAGRKIHLSESKRADHPTLVFGKNQMCSSTSKCQMDIDAIPGVRSHVPSAIYIP